VEAQVLVPQALNYWAILVAAAAYFVLGALWYAPPVFGKVWRTGIGKTDEQVKADFSPWNLVWTFIFSFVAAYGVARLVQWSGGTSAGDGLLVAFLAGVCFAAATVAMHHVMEKRPCSLTVVNALYSIVGFLLMGLIVGAWR